MVTRSSDHQSPVFDVRQFRPSPYPVWSWYGILERYGALIIRREDFPDFDGTRGGEEGWDPVLVAKLELIRQRNGWADRTAVDAGHNDLRVKACLGLGVDEDGPSQSTLCRIRLYMQEHGLDAVYNQRFIELLKALELLKEEAPVAVDTVPIAGAGQVQDSFNLLAGVIRRGLSRLASLAGESQEATATRLGLTRHLSRSVKGSAEIEWRDEEERRQFLSQLVAEATQLQEAIAAAVASETESDGQEEPEVRQKPEPDDEPEPSGGTQLNFLDAPEPTRRKVDERTPSDSELKSRLLDELDGVSDRLNKILEDDVEVDSMGMVRGIRQRPAGDRMISATDQDMRHGRKSASTLIAGYKAQIVAAILHGWILLTKVIPANRHDGQDLPELAERLGVMSLRPAYYAGDHAYGTLENHRHFQDLLGDVELVARNARTTNGGRFTKDDFRIDLEKREMTCLAGITVPWTWATRDGRRGWRFQFSGDDCVECPLRQFCISHKSHPAKGRSFFIDEERERALREHLRRRDETDFRDKIKGRQVVERANAGFAQCGGKKARRFGRRATQFDTNLSALAYNLRRLASLADQSEEIQQALEERARALFFFFLASAIVRVVARVDARRFHRA